ncbi:MAG: hypothetical protein WD872_18805, partial [Pirellulaceae bacterium]
MPRRSSLPIASLALLLGLLCLDTARAVVVLKKGSQQPLLGHLLRQDENRIVIRESLPGGGAEEHVILRGEIAVLLITVDPQRLAALDPKQPQMYREYAEELAEKARDPEARDAAVRLYHMAAWLGEGKLRHGALLGLAALAGSPDQQRQWQAAAYLYDPDHDRRALGAAGKKPLAAGPATQEGLAELLAAVRALRQGRGDNAREMILRGSSTEALAAISKIVTREQLLALAAARSVNDAGLLQLLTAEIALERALSDQPADKAAAERVAAERNQPSWSAAIRMGG